MFLAFPRLAYLICNRLVVGERFPELLGKMKQLLLGFPTTYFPEQGFRQALHRTHAQELPQSP